MSQTSGSITIDTSSLAASIVKGLEPVLLRIAESVTALTDTIGSVPLSEQETAQVLNEHDVDFGMLLSVNLREAGYTLIRLPEPAHELLADLTAQIDQASRGLAREDDWFSRGAQD